MDRGANSANSGASKMEFSSLDGGEDAGCNGVGFVETSKHVAMMDEFFIGSKPFFGVAGLS